MAHIIKKSSMLLGRCIPCVKQNASKIRINTLEFDSYVNMYFDHFDFIYAYDPKKVCKTGDVVLVQKLQEKITTVITHKVLKVVYPLGDITDPITGKKLSGLRYRDDIEEENKLFGKSKNAFDYEKAPPRGWQGSKKDFTEKPTYTKYHETGENDPYAV